MKIKVEDTLFSLLVRRRDKYVCQRCKAQYNIDSGASLQCSHHYGRARRRLRWSPINAVALCAGCHRQWHSHPDESAAWLAEHLGPERHAELRKMARETIKASKSVVLEIRRIQKEDWESGEFRDPVAVLREQGIL
jgi:hypothetical protein